MRVNLKQLLREGLLQERESGGMVFNVETDEDRTEIAAVIDGSKVGSITTEILFDAYQYEFDDVFTWEEFEELYPDDNIVKIEHLEVDDDFKGEGIASMLLNKMFEYMKGNGEKQFYLNASPMGFRGLNLNNLVGFYKRYGFEVIKHQGGNSLMRMIIK